METQSKKVYYQIDAEMQEKAENFGVAPRKKYITKVNNPFGFREGILFTGRGVMEAMSKTRLNFMSTLGVSSCGDVGSDEWCKLRDYIRTVSCAIAYDTIVSAKGKLKGGEMFETQYDVETDNYNFDDFFYDEEKNQIYRFEIVN